MGRKMKILSLGAFEWKQKRILRLGVKGVPPYKGYRAGKAVWCDLYFYEERFRQKLQKAGFAVFPVKGGIPSGNYDETRAVLPPNEKHRGSRHPNGSIVWHGILERDLSQLLSARGKENIVVLTPGAGAAYGIGVYGAWSYGCSYAPLKDNDAVCIYVPKEKMGLIKDLGVSSYLLFPEQTLFIEPVALVRKEFQGGGTKRIVYAVLKESHRTGILYSRPAPGGSRATMALNRGVVTAHLAQRTIKNLTPSKPTFFTRLLGFGVGFTLLTVGRWKKSPRHTWLGKFLTGMAQRGVVMTSPETAYRGLANLNMACTRQLTDTKEVNGVKASLWLVRPEASEDLFWMVGSFTALRVDDEDGTTWWYGEDVYDFHPQMGQGVAVQFLGGKVWSFSEEVTPNQSRFFKGLKRLLKDKKGRWIRMAGGKYLPSNDLWNRLGGRPFTTVVACRMDESQPEIPANKLTVLQGLYREWTKRR